MIRFFPKDRISIFFDAANTHPMQAIRRFMFARLSPRRKRTNDDVEGESQKGLEQRVVPSPNVPLARSNYMSLQVDSILSRGDYYDGFISNFVF